MPIRHCTIVFSADLVRVSGVKSQFIAGQENGYSDLAVLFGNFGPGIGAMWPQHRPNIMQLQSLLETTESRFLDAGHIPNDYETSFHD